MSKVDQYIVYLDGDAVTVWGYLSQAMASALRLAHAKTGRITVVEYLSRGRKVLVFDSDQHC